ncbi:MAG: tRNA (adenosine(37)-N6)-dimethylallyltransferase MiaA [Ruminococcus flavefaciens]|nr:tRNA (adenosine(37)-N6)-dimethylallyltransferase MiaA [Ruminococcus flavefaciens]MCM1229509.1 tRNA (adenosine(37)-N6)-dimethylallyltransferase MiaA [Ruminococcus flavefaciens]
MSDKPFVLVICGPTASGKTWLGIELAKEYNGEIISADSMQVYKGMDIASAKPTEEEMQGIPHHLISCIDRDSQFSVADYVQLANREIQEVLAKGKLPIIVGGTGLYIDSLIDNIKFSDMESDDEYRAMLYNTARTKGNHALYSELLRLDPESAETIHENNLVRLVRALEVIHATGRKYSEVKAENRQGESFYDALFIGLNTSDRSVLYERINQRVDEMVENGLLAEAESLWKESGMKTAGNAIGYKELIPYFENTMPLDECIDKIKQETRRYAKRQLTWFRRNERIRWIIIDDFSQKYEILEKSKKHIENYRII